MKGRVLIIAGSDSGGGAGIQADIKAVTAMGSYAATAITAVTAQNTVGVRSIHTIPPEMICEQIDAVLSDIGADIIKVGMIGQLETGEAVLEALEPWSDLPLVLDPVLVATSGDSLGAPGLTEQIKHHFVQRARVITPNLPELHALTGAGEDEPISGARRLLAAGAQAVLVKGGHGNADTLRDYLVTDESETVYEHPRLGTPNTHGTGCTLASALAANLAQGLSLEAAVRRAINYVQDAIVAAPGLGHGHGPLNHQVSQAAYEAPDE